MQIRGAVMHTVFTYDHHGSVQDCKKQVLHFSRVRGHSRSLKMVPVDTAYATCYSPLNRWTHRRSWGRCWSNGWTGLCSDECCRRRGCSCDQALKQHNNHMPLIQLLMQHQLQSAYGDMVDHSIQWRHVYYYEGMQSMTWLRPCLPTNKCCTMRTNDGNYVCQSATLCLEVDIMVQLLYM